MKHGFVNFFVNSSAFRKPLYFCALLSWFSAGAGLADVTLPAIFSEHMVLLKAEKVPIWGKATAGEQVTVTLNDQTAKAIADASGKWKTELNLQNSGPGPFEMTVQGNNRIAIADVVVGEVWLASGQSNMAHTLKSIEAVKDIADSAHPMIRQFVVPTIAVPTPQEDCKGTWTVAAPSTTERFSAVGYFFAKKLNEELKAPVGIINSAWSGTPIEPWMSPEAFDADAELKAGRDTMWERWNKYPEQKKNFIPAFAAWLKEMQREDKIAADPAAFTGADVSMDGWTTVTLPGKLSGNGLPATGAIWLRKEIDIPPALAGKPLFLELLQFEGFESVYWNGEKFSELTYDKRPGDAFLRQYTVPAELVKAGKTIIAVRIYTPVTAPTFIGSRKRFAAGSVSLEGKWMAKAEYELPTLDDAALKAAPRLPQEPALLPQLPGAIFNGMINPILPYAIRGALWYQGEGNLKRAWQYRIAFPLMIQNWRKQWGRGDFPFYFCQLANMLEKETAPTNKGCSWAELRESQGKALDLPNTGQAVLIDIGEADDIHPRNKQEVGARLARIALARDYGKDVVFSGPTLQSTTIENGKVILKFGHTNGGLVAKPVPETYLVKSATNLTAPLVRNSPNSELESFAICGADGKWVWADAKIEGDTVIVSSPQVTQPVAVRYAWAYNPSGNLYNGAGLPASPFRTDDFPTATKDHRYGQ